MNIQELDARREAATGNPPKCCECLVAVVDEQWQTCGDCWRKQQAKISEDKAREVSNSYIFSDHLVEHAEAKAIATALHMRSLSAMKPRAAWQEHLDWTLIQHAAREIPGEFSVVGPGEISGIEILDRAAQKRLRELGLLVLGTCQNLDDGTPCGSGYWCSTEGAKVGRGLAAMRVPHRPFDWHFEDNLFGTHHGANDLLAKVFDDLDGRNCYFKSLKVGSPSCTAATLAETLEIPQMAALACCQALVKRRVVEQCGSRFKVADWRFHYD